MQDGTAPAIGTESLVDVVREQSDVQKVNAGILDAMGFWRGGLQETAETCATGHEPHDPELANEREEAGMTDFLDRWAAESPENARLVAQERLITQVTEALWQEIKEAGVVFSSVVWPPFIENADD